MDEVVGDLEWDSEKRQKALAERGLVFVDAVRIERDGLQTIEDLRVEYGERRFNSYGYLDGVLYVFCWTPRDQRRRVISMRKANDRERRSYKARQETGHS